VNFPNDLIIAGDTLDFQTAVVGYPATDGWTLKYYLTPRVAGTQILLTAATASDGTSYRVQVSPATSAPYASGMYDWRARVEKVGAEVTVDQGSVEIQVKVAGLTASDSRSHARKVFDAISAVIEGRASKDQQEYSIGGRSLKRTSIADLLVLRDKYKAEVQNEIAAEQIADGGSNPRTFGVRFRRV